MLVLSCLTLGLYGAYTVLRDAHIVGRLVGKRRASLPLGLLYTALTLGIFPGVYVVVLAFDLQRHAASAATAGRTPHFGYIVLLLDISSLLLAFFSAGIAIAVSVLLWSYACYLLARELSHLAPSAFPALTP